MKVDANSISLFPMDKDLTTASHYQKFLRGSYNYVFFGKN